jgi:hypothetical protein
LKILGAPSKIYHLTNQKNQLIINLSLEELSIEKAISFI